ncbi:MAG: hypothetical protein N3B10_01360 [Armatimonadetes bacterium]|nr:hypothetical protein [Armatimonadota bacterium]
MSQQLNKRKSTKFAHINSATLRKRATLSQTIQTFPKETSLSRHTPRQEKNPAAQQAFAGCPLRPAVSIIGSQLSSVKGSGV